MNIIQKIFFTLAVLIIVGCGDDSDSMSVGVSLGGTGSPEIGVVVPPVKVEQPIETAHDEYILWSRGLLVHQCASVKLSMQLMNPSTLSGLDIGIGYPVKLDETQFNRRVGILIKIENESSSKLYNFFDNCQPSLQLEQYDNQKKSVNLDFECANRDSVITLNPGENLESKFVFYLPNGGISRNFVYTHTYSIENIKGFKERETCNISYPIILEK